MIIHIIQYKLYTAAFIDFINKEYGCENHQFLVYGKMPNAAFKIKEYPNILYLDELRLVHKMPDVIKRLNSAEKIIIHSNNLSVTKFLLRKPSLMKKSYMTFWGFDIYCYRNKPVGIKNKIYTLIQKWQIRNVKAVGTLTDKDKDVLYELIPGIKGKWFLGAYMSTTNFDKLFELRSFEKSKNPCRIIVGNSSSETNQHHQIFNRLSKYKDENIIVYCPLSYGDPKYRQKVIEQGNKIFGEKFIPLTELMPLEKYWELLNECSVGFFNNNRQQAMGNISLLLGLGAKVYIRTDTSMWQRYTDNGYKINDIKAVGEIPWTDVIAYDEDTQRSNAAVYEKVSSMDRMKEIWDKVLFSDKSNQHCTKGVNN